MNALTPAQKLALRNLNHMGATAEDVGCEPGEAGVSAVSLTHLHRAGLVAKGVEKRTVGARTRPGGRDPAKVSVTIYWLTPEGRDVAKVMDT